MFISQFQRFLRYAQFQLTLKFPVTVRLLNTPAITKTNAYAVS